MPRKIVTGHGMTARETVQLDAREDVKEISDMFRRTRVAIERHGLFGVVSKEAESVCRAILNEFEGEPALDSPEDFARTILQLIEGVRSEIKKGNSDAAARFAFSAGLEWGKAWMKWAWEPDAMRGEKVAGGEKNSAAQTNERHVALRERRFARMRALVPDVGVNRAAVKCETEGLGPRDAIKRQWNRHGNKKRDT